MDRANKLLVRYNGKLVGTMALYKNTLAAFEYDKEWLADGFSISPFSLPLEQQVFMPRQEPFDGLYGVFSDSLPDVWGRLLTDRLLLKNKVNPMQISSMDRLAIVGSSGMGALTYEPDYHFEMSKEGTSLDLDRIAEECASILKTDYSDDLDTLFKLGGSSGGARPKILTEIDGEEWIVKFPSSEDSKNIGEQEYKYSICAKKCGIVMEETKLFPSKLSSGYFGTKRFDRIVEDNGKMKRIHMISASGILETSHRIPNLDYNILMKLTLELTRDFVQIEKLFRVMCFNVFAHNRDDHSKNFTYLYDDNEEKWILSPAYDLTYSYSIGGEHATTVNGNGKNPSMTDIIEVAKNIGFKEKKAKNIADEIKMIVDEHGLSIL